MVKNTKLPMEAFIDKFKRARNAGTPIFAISCFDPAATMSRIQKSIVGAGQEEEETSPPVIQWDIIEGWRHRNKAGELAVTKALDSTNASQMETINPTESLKIALSLPPDVGTVLFMLNTHHYLEQDAFLQALWNARDLFKSNQIALVMLGPDFNIPAQVQHDVFLMDEPLPTEEEIRAIIEEVIGGTEAKVTAKEKDGAVDALRGLSAFPAESSVAMNLRKSGLDVQGLWEAKRKLIGSTPGLKVYQGEEKFEAIGGCDQIKRFMRGVIKGKDAPNVIVFLDEGEKLFAGAMGSVGDSSGVAQDQLASMLSYMEDNESDGAIFYGPPGAAKSAIAKATGNEAGVPTIMFDLGGMKGSLVGKSEAQLRTALKVITAVGGGRAFFIMTCNKIVDLPPELRRRFTSGIFFFDLPSAEERASIWPIYLAKYGIDTTGVSFEFDEGWTGAEIRNCCRMAYRQGIPLTEAAKYIVPVSMSAGAQITALRRQATGAYLSASDDGVYRYDGDDRASAVSEKGAKARKVALED